jgi:hypothetical protein
MDVSECFLGQRWCIRESCMSQLMCQGALAFKMDSQGAFLVEIDVAGCFRAQHWCIRLFSLSKWMSQGVLWVKMEVSGHFLVQNWCLTVLSGTKLVLQAVSRVTIDVPEYFLVTIDISGRVNGCPTVFSGSQLMSWGFLCFKTYVSNRNPNPNLNPGQN